MSDEPPVPTIRGGDGSRERPFVVTETAALLSTALQIQIIEKVFGKGEYSADSKQRRYSESPHGTPGNKDLCEHTLAKSGKHVWFDLSAVSRYHATHPNANEETMRMLGASEEDIADSEAKAYVRAQPAGGELKSEKRGGCLSIIVVLLVIVTAVTAFTVILI
jgi:hypothetical protein